MYCCSNYCNFHRPLGEGSLWLLMSLYLDFVGFAVFLAPNQASFPNKIYSLVISGNAIRSDEVSIPPKPLLFHSDNTGPPLRKFDWIATSSCGPNRRQILNRRYLNDLIPPVSGSTNDAPHTNNAGNAIYQW